MSYVGVLVDRGNEVLSFVDGMRKRMRENNVIRNPFVGDISDYLIDDKKILVVLLINPVYFNFSVIGWFSAAIIFLLWGMTWWLVAPLFVGSLGVFWSSWFFRQMLKKGMRKAGYGGPIKKVARDDAIRMLVVMHGPR